LVLAQGVYARKGRLFRLVLRSFFSILFFFYFSLFYYRLINKRFTGGSTSGTWRRRVTDFSGLLFWLYILLWLQPANPVSVFWQSSRPRARIIIQSPIRWKTFRRFAAGNEPSGPFFRRRRWRRPLFEYPMTMCNVHVCRRIKRLMHRYIIYCRSCCECIYVRYWSTVASGSKRKER